MTNQPELKALEGNAAWTSIWKWMWFARETWQHDFRTRKEGTRRALSSLLPQLGVRSILDCTCGLGWKTILLHEMGLDAEGSDGCSLAVRYASELARSEGLSVRFFRSRWQNLSRESGRKYDCVYNDSVAWMPDRKTFSAAAKGMHAVLKRGGYLIFQDLVAHQWAGDVDFQAIIGKEFQGERRFEVLPLYEKNGIKLTTLTTREKTPDGILGNRVHIIEDHGQTRIEIASVLDLCKWTWADYNDIFLQAGFREIHSVKEKGTGPKDYILNVVVK